MPGFDPEMADIRFGCGLSPIHPAPNGIDAMLSGVADVDLMAERFPIESFETFWKRVQTTQELWKQRRATRGTEKEAQALAQIRQMKLSAREGKAKWLAQTVLRRVQTPTGFRERLVYFWADHFTAQGKAGVIKRATSPYIEEAVRPNISGRFADLLVACVTHPLMLEYLDQHRSVGPNSKRAARAKRGAGLNENLAREVLELHTLGVSGPYTQSDVVELAQLFAGLTIDFSAFRGFAYRADFAEPGSETVLGKSYPAEAKLETVMSVLEDLANHPATARHVATKLAMHFVSDEPSEDLVAHLEQTFLRTSGDLPALYAALLEHPAAWDSGVSNAKLPIDYVGSALRALAVPAASMSDLDEKQVRRAFWGPMGKMGQPWQTPVGPDGWPEADGAWITPQGLAARIEWAMKVPKWFVADWPDPRAFIHTALGTRATQRVTFAASAAETKAEAIGLVLASPAFQKM